MRVVAGSLRSRPLRAPKGDETRPTSDRVRESLFAVLGATVGSARVLDLYAGSGALAIEALSRGAATATCVEAARAAIVVIRQNAEDLGLGDRLRVLPRRVGDAARTLSEGGPFDLAFVDPPWVDVREGRLAKELSPLLRLSRAVFSAGARLLLEHDARDTPPDLPPFVRGETRRWGDTAVTFYELSDQPPTQPPTQEGE